MDINKILSDLGLDFSDPETKRGAMEAIDAILSSREPPMSMPGGAGGGETEVELDPDLLQPSVKHSGNASDDDIEIEDEEDILSQVKTNDSEDEVEGNSDGSGADGADGDSSSESSGDSKSSSKSDSQDKDDFDSDDESEDSDDSYEDTSDDDNKTDDKSSSEADDEETDDLDDEDSDSWEAGEDEDDAENSDDSGDFDDESDDSGSTDSDDDDFSDEEDEDPEIESTDNLNDFEDSEDETGESEEDEEDFDDEDFDEDDLLDDTYNDEFEDKEIKTKHDARKIKRERTVAAGKKALEDAKARNVSPAKIRELEKAIAALEELTEAVKNIKDLSDDEFNQIINRVFDAIDDVGDTSLTYSSDEDRQIRAQEIKADLANTDTQAELSAEDAAKIRAEHQAVQAREKETAKYQAKARGSFKGFQDFLNSLYKAIAMQVHTEETRDDTWSAINRRYSDTGVLKQGQKIQELPNKRIPVIDFYFDQSGSWDDNDLKVGEKAVQCLADLKADGKINLNVYYFSNDVYENAADARADGGTAGWNEIIKNIVSTQATNVIIMTDADMEDWWKGDKALSYTVPGYVWYLWRNGINAPRLPRDLRGRGGTQQFSFNASDA